MSGRVLLLILFLYTALAWVVAGMRPDGQFVYYGLLWTAIGLAVALVAVIVQQGVRAWRASRERSASKPAKLAPKPTVMSEEASALEALRREAMARLSSAHGTSRLGGSAFSGRGLFLVLGPSNSGKTQTIVNSGLDPQLLSGQVRGDSAVVSTRIANFWLAQENVFVELGGRLYESDQERWTNLLKVLCGTSEKPLWKRLWRDEQGPLLRGVLLFHDVQYVMASPDSAPTGAQSRIAQERLQAVADVFGIAVPVYAVFTKSDSVKFFGEYFGRLAQNEASQTFGYTLAADQPVASANPMPWSERETRRLTKAFSTVYRHLAERRLLHLMRESDPSRKPDIYEFPREFRRIRGVLVQMLTDAFKPDPLKLGPVLRGFYFTGTRAAEAVLSDQTVHGLDRTSLGGPRFGGDVDYSEATRIFEPGGFKAVGPGALGSRGRGPLQLQWMFTRQLFLETIPSDLPPAVAPPSQPILGKYRVMITALVAGLSLLMGLVWLQSWWRNWNLIQEAKASVERVERLGARSGGGLASLEYLVAIDQVRKQIEGLNEKELGMRWLLYTGDDVRERLESFYFRRLDALMLSELNRRLADRLSRLAQDPPESAEFDPVYRQLATHLAITGGGCGAGDPAVVANVLKTEARELRPTDEPERVRLNEAQIDFYARTLPGGNPVRLPENPTARDRARSYLSKVRSVDRIYEEILIRASKKMPGNVRLSDVSADSSRLLKGPTEVPAVFTPSGWRVFDKEAIDAPNVGSGEPCILGTSGGLPSGIRRDDELSRKVRIKYLQAYKEQWRRFIEKQSLEPYGGLEDAVNKLDLLSGYKSPVLALLAFASNYTHFPADQTSVSLRDKIAEKAPSFLKKASKAIEKSVAQTDPEDSTEQIARAFQPVQWVVAPDAPKWVGDKNQPYVDALAELKDRLNEIRRASGTTPDPALHQQATQSADKAMSAVHNLANGFASTGSEGLDSAVQRLLEAPIRQARQFIHENAEKAQAAGLISALVRFCQMANPILRKYPFSPQSPKDNEATIEDVNSLVAPETGALWKLQQTALADLVARQGAKWGPKAEAQKPRPSQDLLVFLNRMQTLTDAIYPNKTAQPSLQYSLRPVAGSLKGFRVTLEFDGKKVELTESSALQRQFAWPAAQPASAEAKAWISVDGGTQYFGASNGLWGVFRVFGGADPRDLGSTQVQWSAYTVAGGGRVPLQRSVRLEFVSSQGAADLLNPKFFDGLRCPNKAVQ